MAPFIIPPLVKALMAAAGAAAMAHWVVREVRRINADLERQKAVKTSRTMAREALPTLRRDPRTGEWRVM